MHTQNWSREFLQAYHALTELKKFVPPDDTVRINPTCYLFHELMRAIKFIYGIQQSPILKDTTYILITPDRKVVLSQGHELAEVLRNTYDYETI